MSQDVNPRPDMSGMSSGVEAILLHVLVYISILSTAVLDHTWMSFSCYIIANITLGSLTFDNIVQNSIDVNI